MGCAQEDGGGDTFCEKETLLERIAELEAALERMTARFKHAEAHHAVARKDERELCLDEIRNCIGTVSSDPNGDLDLLLGLERAIDLIRALGES